MSLNVEATLRAICAALGITPVEDVAWSRSEVVSHGPFGSEELRGLTDYLAGITDNDVRAAADLVPYGQTQYVVTVDSVADTKARGEDYNALVQERNQNWLRFDAHGMAFANFNDFYRTAYSIKQLPDGSVIQGDEGYPNVIVFPEGGIGRDDVLDAVRRRLSGIGDGFWATYDKIANG